MKLTFKIALFSDNKIVYIYLTNFINMQSHKNKNYLKFNSPSKIRDNILGYFHPDVVRWAPEIFFFNI